LSKRGLPRAGPKSITNLERYLAELEYVRSRGYAVNDEETDAGVRFVGVRIGLPPHPSEPALVLGAPRQRLPREAYPRIAAMLGAAAREIAAAVA
jgi:IclR family acetate operon transcriptional repressor